MHDPTRAEREWHDIEATWADHQTTFIGGAYTLKKFLWIPKEDEMSELFLDKDGRVWGIKQAIYRAKEKHWLLPGTTAAWTAEKVLGGEDSARPLLRVGVEAQLEKERQEEEDATLARLVPLLLGDFCHSRFRSA